MVAVKLPYADRRMLVTSLSWEVQFAKTQMRLRPGADAGQSGASALKMTPVPCLRWQS